jgi:tetratricopeptide (TPR) repeat protein
MPRLDRRLGRLKGDGLARLNRDGLPLLLAGLTVAVLVAWAATGGGYESQPTLGGGYDPGPWYLGALAIVGLACATALGIRRVEMSRLTMLAAAALGGYVAWSFLSILWAHDQGSALLGSDRALVYLAGFLMFAILPWRAWTLRAALGLLVAGFVALAILTAIRIGVLADPSKLYLEARLIYPLGYYNADAALFTLTAFVAIALGARRDAAAIGRVLGLVIAAVCLQLAVLGQSRGWLFSLPIMLALALLVLPGRLRLLLFALLPAATTAVVAPSLLRIYSRATVNGVTLPAPRLAHVLHQQGSHAAQAMLLADAVMALLAASIVLVDRRLRLSSSTARRVNGLAAAAAAVALLAGLGAGAIATHGHPIGRIESAWRSFANASNDANGASRFTKLGSERVDMWRVALHEFAAHPLVGIGQDNFAASYLRLRHTDQEPRWVHSLELRMLTHTGLVGALLFALFMLTTVIAALRASRSGYQERAAAGVALLAAIVWLVYGSIDWFWEFPVLSLPAFAFAGAAAALGRPADPSHGHPVDPSHSHPVDLSHSRPAERAAGRSTRQAQGRRAGPALRGGRLLAVGGRLGAVLLSGGALAALLIPFIAAREIQKATTIWPDRPMQAYRELRSASSLLPFDAQIYLVGGAIALNLEEPERARDWLAEAQRRDEQGWLAPFALGLVYGEQGRRSLARSELTRALRSNPREPLIGQAIARLSNGHPLSFPEAQAMLSERQQARFGR